MKTRAGQFITGHNRLTLIILNIKRMSLEFCGQTAKLTIWLGTWYVREYGDCASGLATSRETPKNAIKQLCIVARLECSCKHEWSCAWGLNLCIGDQAVNTLK